MKRLFTLSRALLAAAALTLVASSAYAVGGINLAWNDCGAAGASSRTFACNTNSGASTLYASVIVPAEMPQLNGQAGVLDLQTNEAALSAWWDIGGCRVSNSISADFNFLANFACMDPWVGSAAGGLNYTAAFNGVPNRARIRTVCAIPGSTSIDNVNEWYMFKVNILHARSTGAGSCAGCADGACIAFNSILVTQPVGVGDYSIITPAVSNYATWQVGGANVSGGCPGTVPAKTRTWGSVKSLYR